MTTFPSASPAIEPAEHPRGATPWINPGARAAYPSGPVPGDAQPRVIELPPTDSQDNPQPGRPGLPQMPTGPNTAGGAHRP